MASPSDNWAFEALGSALDELADARREYEAAVLRLHKVEEAVRSLRALVGEDDDDVFDVDQDVVAERNRIVHSGTAAQPPKRKQSVHSSTMRVLRAIAAAERPLDSDEIIAFFRNSKWPETDGAIQQAARRCQGYGFVWRDPERRYVLTNSGTDALERAILDEKVAAYADAVQENWGGEA
jgi:hypothetical protein